MKFTCSLILLLFFTVASYAQTGNDTGTAKPPMVFQFVEQMPEFPGGQSKLFEYLSRTVQYDDMASVNGIAGKSIAKFQVTQDGFVDSIVIVKSIYPSLDAEFVRVLKRMPRWKPGYQAGKAVKVYFTLPLTWSTENSNADAVYLDTAAGTYVGNRRKLYESMPYPKKGKGFLTIPLPAIDFGKIKQANPSITVLVTIEPDGTMDHLKVIGSSHQLLAGFLENHMKYLHSSWEPAVQNGKKVACDMLLQFNFTEQ